MTTQDKLVRQGAWAAAAAGVASGDYLSVALGSGNSQTATANGSGTAQSSATASPDLAGATLQLTADITKFTTVGTTYNTAQLVNQGAAQQMVFNAGANVVLIYPPLGGSINGLTVNLPVGVQAAKAATFTSPDGLTWFAAHAG